MESTSSVIKNESERKIPKNPFLRRNIPIVMSKRLPVAQETNHTQHNSNVRRVKMTNFYFHTIEKQVDQKSVVVTKRFNRLACPLCAFETVSRLRELVFIGTKAWAC
jgi:hypothetical protein